MTAIPLDSDTVRYLCGLKQTGIHLGLERMLALLAALGDPHRRLPVIHVAGTNGKGSVAAMLEAIVRSAGWRVGLYTSPHLVRLGERVQVNRVPLSASELQGCVGELRPIADQMKPRPSYFEFMTALALEHFRRSACDIAMVEVGLGGRLDATNIVETEVAAITSIGFDHRDFLGDTLAAIAREKAGIIKPGRPVVIGRLPPAAEAVVRAVAAERGALVSSVFDVFGEPFASYPGTNLLGDYQRVNAATATLVARQLEAHWRLNEPQIAAALRAVDWPARWQRLNVGGRFVVVDAAHNAEGAATLDANLSALRSESAQRPIVVFGATGRERATPLLDVVARHAGEIRFVTPPDRRACGFEELVTLVPGGFDGAIIRDSLDAIFPGAGICLPAVDIAQPVVVTGSIYLAGAALVRIDPTRGPLESELQDF